MTHGYKRDYLIWLAHRSWNTAERDGDGVEILLYDDQADDPGLDSTISDLESEPSGYTRPTVDWGTPYINTTQSMVTHAQFGEVSPNLSGADGEVDSFGIVASLEYFDEMNVAEPSGWVPPEDPSHTTMYVDVLVGTGPMDRREDLANIPGEWTFEPGVTLTSIY